MKLFLDSSAIIEYLKGNEKVREVMSQAEEIYTSTICAYEVLMGEKFKEFKGQKSSYKNADRLFTVIDPLPFTYSNATTASEIAAKLAIKGKKVDEFDGLIAAQALELGATVFTKDIKHFDVLKVEIGLSIEKIS